MLVRQQHSSHLSPSSEIGSSASPGSVSEPPTSPARSSEPSLSDNDQGSDVESMDQEENTQEEEDVDIPDVGNPESSNLMSFKFEDLCDPDTQVLIMGNLSKYLQCVDCHEIPFAEIYSCISGHPICHKCMDIEYTSCSVCSEPTTDTRNVLAEVMVTNLEFNCKNRSLGCLQILGSKEIEKHLKEECVFRAVPCYVYGNDLCNGKLIPFAQFSHHVQEKHSCVFNKGPQNLSCDSLTKDKTWPLQGIIFDGNLFLQHVVYQDSMAYIWFSFFGSPDLQTSNQYSATIHLVKKIQEHEKVTIIGGTAPVQHFRKSFEQVKAEKGFVPFTKEELSVASSRVTASPFQGHDDDDEITVYRHSWDVKTTIFKAKPQLPDVPVILM